MIINFTNIPKKDFKLAIRFLKDIGVFVPFEKHILERTTSKWYSEWLKKYSCRTKQIDDILGSTNITHHLMANGYRFAILSKKDSRSLKFYENVTITDLFRAWLISNGYKTKEELKYPCDFENVKYDRSKKTFYVS